MWGGKGDADRLEAHTRGERKECVCQTRARRQTTPPTCLYNDSHHPSPQMDDALIGKGAWDCDAGRPIAPDKQVSTSPAPFPSSCGRKERK